MELSWNVNSWHLWKIWVKMWWIQNHSLVSCGKPLQSSFQIRNKPSLSVSKSCLFGFKYGIPIDADLVFDVRFLPNPITYQNWETNWCGWASVQLCHAPSWVRRFLSTFAGLDWSRFCQATKREDLFWPLQWVVQGDNTVVWPLPNVAEDLSKLACQWRASW